MSESRFRLPSFTHTADQVADALDLTDDAIARRLAFVQFLPQDAENISLAGNVLRDSVDDAVEAFFGFLELTPEARPLLQSPTLLGRARELKREHLTAWAEGRFDREYARQRLELGILYSTAGLEVRVFLGAYHAMLRMMAQRVQGALAGDLERGFSLIASLEKVAFFDIGLLVDVLIDGRERTIRTQQEALRELSTPVLAVDPLILVVPVIGALDPSRASQLRVQLLAEVWKRRARVVVVDVTGLGAVDTRSAHDLLLTLRSARLMGATPVLSGISTEVAVTLVHLGIDLGEVQTFGDLQSALEHGRAIVSSLSAPVPSPLQPD